jgi:hypothetical protein
MAIIDWTTSNSLFCIAHAANSGTPTQAVSTVAESFSVDVTHGTGTVTSVTVDWGDGSATETLTAGTAPAYDGTHTYTTAGKYDIRVTTLLSKNETDYEKFTITVS